MQLAPSVALAGQARVARMDAHPHPDRTRSEHLLALRRRHQRLARLWEGVEEGVSLRIDLDAAAGREGLPQESAVLGERLDVALLPELLDQPGRALDVGEEESDGAARELR